MQITNLPQAGHSKAALEPTSHRLWRWLASHRLATLDPILRNPLLPGAAISRTDYRLNTTCLTAPKFVTKYHIQSTAPLVLLETLSRALHMCWGIHCIHPSHKAECTILKPSEREIPNFTLPIPAESSQRTTHVPLLYNHYLCQQPMSMKSFMGIIGTPRRKPVLLQGLRSLQWDLHSALNCAVRLFIRLVIYQKSPKHQKSTTELL